MKKDLTEQEREELYRTRLDETFRPYTVIDVITKVYHRSFEDDLKTYISEHPEEFKTTSDEWSVARVWVNDLRIIRPESVFNQLLDDFRVDIAVEAKIKLGKPGGSPPRSAAVTSRPCSCACATPSIFAPAIWSVISTALFWMKSRVSRR